MHSPFESCEKLRLLGHRLLEVSGSLDKAYEYTALYLIQWKITEHRLNCPICVASERRSRFGVLEGGGVPQHSDAEDFLHTDTPCLRICSKVETPVNS